jgi:hypothetical protein
MIAMRFNLTRQMPPAAGKVALLAMPALHQFQARHNDHIEVTHPRNR